MLDSVSRSFARAWIAGNSEVSFRNQAISHDYSLHKSAHSGYHQQKWHGNVEFAKWKPPNARFESEPTQGRELTIGIGLLCEGGARILLAADTLMTYTAQGQPISGNRNVSKFYPLPHKFAACIADDSRVSNTLAAHLFASMEKLDPNERSFADRVRLALESAFDTTFVWCRSELLRGCGITEDEWLHDSNLIPAKRKKADRAVNGFQVPVQILVAGFNGSANDEGPILLQGSYGRVDTIHDYAPIGSGADVALHWLNVREQNAHMSVTKSYYHIKEATFFCSHNPTVGDRSHVILLAPGFAEMLSPKQSSHLVQKWWELLGPKSTSVLDEDAPRKDFEDAFGITLPPKPKP